MPLFYLQENEDIVDEVPVCHDLGVLELLLPQVLQEIAAQVCRLLVVLVYCYTCSLYHLVAEMYRSGGGFILP